MNIASSFVIASPSTIVAQFQPGFVPSPFGWYDRCSIVASRSVLGFAWATVWTRRKFGSVYVSLGRMLGFSFGIGVSLQVTGLLRRPVLGHPAEGCKPYATRPSGVRT